MIIVREKPRYMAKDNYKSLHSFFEVADEERERNRGGGERPGRYPEPPGRGLPAPAATFATWAEAGVQSEKAQGATASHSTGQALGRRR